MIVFGIIMGILTTAVIFGIGYLFYEIFSDMLKPKPEKTETPVTPPKLKFKKPNL